MTKPILFTLNFDPLPQKTFDVLIPYGSIKRKFTIVEGKNSGVSITGRRHRDIMGTGFSYSLRVEPNPNNRNDYDMLYEELKGSHDFHSITMPYSQGELVFDRMFLSSITDTFAGRARDMQIGATIPPNEWTGMNLDFEYTKLINVRPPQRNNPVKHTDHAMGVTVDGNTYRVLMPLNSISRTMTVVEGAGSGDSIDGERMRDILGSGFSYRMRFEPDPECPLDYDEFYQLMASSVESHVIKVPFSQGEHEFTVSVSSGEDTFMGYWQNDPKNPENKLRLWSGLSIDFEYIDPVLNYRKV